MNVSAPPNVLVHFADLRDPRVERTRLHPLLSVVAIALCGVICGADSWVEVAAFGELRREWLSGWLELPAGIPAHDTFGRVFAALDPVAFETCFAGWVRAVAQATGGQVVALDGKVLRGSHDHGAGRAALDLVSAWASANRLVLAQVAVAQGSNEIPAIPALLRLLTLRGCIVTIDAIGCQTAIAQAIRAQGADYVLALKANQESLYQAVGAAFAERSPEGRLPYRHTTHREVDKGHGRVEVRTTTVIDDPALLAWLNPDHAWPGLAGVARVEAERRLAGESSRETRYYLASLPAARPVHDAVRSHWGIENGVHWVLDMAFREDLSRVRVGHGAHNFSLLRRLSLNLLRQDHAARCGIKARRLKAALSPAYLLATLNGSF
ncbi:MAG TPA: ISAs1 family transposase [Streptosporangiaceae bacterium]|nr:ISAs1 family transposase [Streptosporangiaceae bacterium]